MNKDTNAWQFMKEKKFLNAIKIYDDLYNKEKNVLYLRNKTLALMNLKKYDSAIKNLNQIIKIQPELNEADYVRLGISYWCLENREKALEYWKIANQTKYTIFAGTIPPALELFWALKNNDLNVKPPFLVPTESGKIRDY